MIDVNLGKCADGRPLFLEIAGVTEDDDVPQVAEAHVARAERHDEVDEASERRLLVRQQTQHDVVAEMVVAYRLRILQVSQQMRALCFFLHHLWVEGTGLGVCRRAARNAIWE